MVSDVPDVEEVYLRANGIGEAVLDALGRAGYPGPVVRAEAAAEDKLAALA